MPKHAMIEAKFRRLMLIAPETVRQSVLSDAEIEMVKYVERQVPDLVGTRKVADAFDITVQNAGTRLTRLVEKGYLLRTCQTDPTCGKMYLYQMRADVWGGGDE